ERLRVESLAERRRAGHVREEHGDGLPHLPRRAFVVEPLAALAAEAGAVGVVPTAGKTRAHSRTLRGFRSSLHRRVGGSRRENLSRPTRWQLRTFGACGGVGLGGL